MTNAQIDQAFAENSFKESCENKDRACDECGLIHKNGISRHGRCYHCGGDLVAFDFNDYERTAVTPKGIEIFEQKTK